MAPKYRRMNVFDKNQLHYEDDFDLGFEEYDPLENPIEEDDDEDESPVDSAGDSYLQPEYSPDTASNLTTTPTTAPTPLQETLPPEARIAKLMQDMGLRSSTLRKLIAYCEEARSAAEVNAKADALQENAYSVFSAANLCALLENAGAIKRITKDGMPYELAVIEPHTVVDENGIEYLEASDAPDVYWISTEAGMEALKADKPNERTKALLLEDADYLPVYKRILELGTAEGGASMADIAAAIDKEPLLKDRKYTASHFVELLEGAGAMEWLRPWFTTQAGLAALREIDASCAKA